MSSAPELERIRIRSIPVERRRGKPYRYEVDVPPALNGGTRYRSGCQNLPDAQDLRQAIENKIRAHGTSLPFESGRAVGGNPRTKALARAASGGLRVSQLFAFWRDMQISRGGVATGTIDIMLYFVDLLIDKYGDIPVADCNVAMCNGLLDGPPATVCNLPRQWNSSTRDLLVQNLGRLWAFGGRYLVDDFGRSPVVANPWERIYTLPSDGRDIEIFDDFDLLQGAVDVCANSKRLFCYLPALSLKLHCGLITLADLAGGTPGSGGSRLGKWPLLWDQIHLDPSPEYPDGWVDIQSITSDGRVNKGRRVPLTASTRTCLLQFRPYFADHDPVLPGSPNAFHTAVRRCLRTAAQRIGISSENPQSSGASRHRTRNACIAAWVGLEDRHGARLHPPDRIALWAGWGMTEDMLLQQFAGRLTHLPATRFLSIGVGADWRLPADPTRTRNKTA